MLVIEQLHAHLHQGFQQLGRVVGHHAHEQGVLAGAAAHGLGIGGYVLPARWRGFIARLGQHAPVRHRDPGREIPGDRELLAVLGSGLPDLGQIHLLSTGWKHGRQV